MYILFTFLILFFFSCTPPDPFLPYGSSISQFPLKENPSAVFPSPNWEKEESSLRSPQISSLESYLFTREGSEEERKGIRTNEIVIIQNGKLIYENYDRGYNPQSKHLAWSITKSLLNTLYGIAVRDKKISLDDYAYHYMEEFNRTDKHKKIKIRHLLTMSSGLNANEGYESGPLKSSVIGMLYTSGRQDMGSFCARLDMRAEPGTYTYYSSCDTNILSKILRKIYNKQDYDELPWKEIFKPLGIENVTLEKDDFGIYIFSSYLYISARDLAKIGYLYLNDGVWNGKRILPEGWVDFTRTPSPGYKTTPYYPGLENYIYTAHWYTNSDVPERGLPSPWPSGPKEIFAASGHWGQSMIIIPNLNLVAVRFADDREKKFSLDHYIKLIMDSVEKR